jgi:hypothetical protein
MKLASTTQYHTIEENQYYIFNILRIIYLSLNAITV